MAEEGLRGEYEQARRRVKAAEKKRDAATTQAERFDAQDELDRARADEDEAVSLLGFHPPSRGPEPRRPKDARAEEDSVEPPD